MEKERDILVNHLKNVIKNKNMFKCRICGGSCKPSTGFMNYHNIQIREQQPEFETKLEKCFKCEDCGHSFIN